MSYADIKPADSGGYAIGLLARYSDGTEQTFSDSKFVYSCSNGAIEHFLQVANGPAR